MLQKKFKTTTGKIILIREAKKEDAAALIAYVKKVACETDFLTFGKGEFRKTIKEEQQIIQQHAKAKNQIFLLAEYEGEIVGILNVNANEKSRLRHIGDFGVTVKKDYWGQGIGTNLIECMLEWARKSGVIRKINLVVQTNNKAAIKLYKKLGFKKEGVLRRDSFINGKFYDAYAMGMMID
jgi:RimJ/RimL family protein N-acetyltransferase